MSIDLIQHLSDNMTNSPTDLLSYIDFYHSSYSQEYEDATFLVRNQSDVDMWVNELWDGDPDSVNETNRLLRIWKVDQGMLDRDEFVELAFLDEKDALETVFGHQVDKRTLYELDKAMGEGLRYEDLWMRHLEYPMSRVEYLIY